jgi:hypothetical protein
MLAGDFLTRLDTDRQSLCASVDYQTNFCSSSPELAGISRSPSKNRDEIVTDSTGDLSRSLASLLITRSDDFGHHDSRIIDTGK